MTSEIWDDDLPVADEINAFFSYFFDDNVPPYAEPGLFGWQKKLVNAYVPEDGKPTGQKVMLQVARDHGKSFMMSTICAFVLLRNPKARILYISHDEELAMRGVTQVHNLLSNDTLVDLIGEPLIAGGKTSGGRKASESSKIKKPRRTGSFFMIGSGSQRDPSIEALSVTGKPPMGKRAEFVIKDDLITLQSASSKAEQAYLKKFMAETVGTTEDEFDEWVIGTPKYPGDYYDTLIQSRRYSVHRIPAMSFMPDFERVFTIQPDGRETIEYRVKGPMPELACPEKWTVEGLLAKIDEVDMGLLRWRSEYMLEYVFQTEKAVFDISKIVPYDDTTPNLPKMKVDSRWKAVFDPTTSKEVNVDGDFCALVCGFQDGKDVYLDYAYRAHLSWDDQVELIANLAKKPDFPTIYVEDVGVQHQFMKEVKAASPPRKVKGMILPKGRKQDRICGFLDPIFNGGRLHVRREYIDVVRAEAEFYRAGKDEKDDLLDALSMLVHILRTGGWKPIEVRLRI